MAMVHLTSDRCLLVYCLVIIRYLFFPNFVGFRVPLDAPFYILNDSYTAEVVS